MRRATTLLCLLIGLTNLPAYGGPSLGPGQPIAHSAASTGVFLGSPSLAILDDGTYLASYDTFGPGSTEDIATVMKSTDRGRSWRRLTTIVGQYWSSLFVEGSSVYLLGTNRSMGKPIIRRSTDDGDTWTVPRDSRTGLFSVPGKFLTAPTAVLIDQGRVWKSFEFTGVDGLQEALFSVPRHGDLLDTTRWRMSAPLASSKTWLNGHFLSWEEASVVAVPGSSPKIILRVNTATGPEKAAIISVNENGQRLEFDPEKDFIDLPGGGKKFTVRFDRDSGQYWTLANAVADGDGRASLERVRNTLALLSSPDLRHWSIRRVVLHHPDSSRHGYQYADWHFDGNDIVAVIRVAFDDADGGAHSQHDSNYVTFIRVSDFRASSDQ